MQLSIAASTDGRAWIAHRCHPDSQHLSRHTPTTYGKSDSNALQLVRVV
jgi:hypothetical protein